MSRLRIHGSTIRLTGAAVVDTVHENRAVVPVGFGSVLTLHVLRFAPVSLRGSLPRLRFV